MKFIAKQAIVIGTRQDRKDQLRNCLESIKTNYPIVVVDCGNYELGKIEWVLKYCSFDEFIFLQDSIEIKDNHLFDKVFSIKGSVSICNYPRMFGCYLGKYKSHILKKLIDDNQLNLTTVSKMDAINLEWILGDLYEKYEKPYELFDDLQDSDKFVIKWDKKVMKIENDYLIKYKSIWSKTMVKEQ
jgi:hypothetical protein